MSVSITFEPSGLNGIVAEGTYLIDAARRMGAPLGAGCTSGKGECPECVVSVKTGANLLSPPSLVEQQQLGADRLDQSLRLACQVKIQNHGEVVVMNAARPERPTAVDEGPELMKKFGALPLGKKLTTLMQMEAVAMSEALDSAIEKPLAFGSKAFDALAGKAKEKASRARK